MGTIIFDFDSTLISEESLERILEKHSPDKKKIIQAVTEEGLRGRIPFSESLARRLAIAAPTRAEVLEFGERAKQWMTSGINLVISELRDYEIHIVSGGIYESILPLAKELGIKELNVHAVTLNWNADGSFQSVNEENPFCRSKVEGCRGLKWNSPVISIGDSFSDYQLYEKGLVDAFILYTEHFRCDELLGKGLQEARSSSELLEMILAYGKNESPST